MKLQAIILDLGNVVFELDWHAALKALELEGTEAADFLLKHIQTWPPYDAYERGKLSTAAFLKEVEQLTGHAFPEACFAPAWEKIVKGYFPGVLDALEKVHGRYALYALTNTNPIHLKMLRRRYPELKVFRELFNSVDFACRKPEAEIYQRCETETGFSGPQIAYVDDNEANVTAAHALGWQAKLCRGGGAELIRLLDGWLND